MAEACPRCPARVLRSDLDAGCSTQTTTSMSLRSAFPSALRELRVFGCQQSPASEGVRQFIKGSYAAVKKANPDIPILIREAVGTPARAFARFEYGMEKSVSLQGAQSAQEVEQKIASLLK